MPASQLAQKQVRVVARIVDVLKNSCAADFAGIINHDVAEAENPLEDGGGNRDVLNLTQRNIPSRSRNEAVINFDLRIRDREARPVRSATKSTTANEESSRKEWSVRSPRGRPGRNPA